MPITNNHQNIRCKEKIKWLDESRPFFHWAAMQCIAKVVEEQVDQVVYHGASLSWGWRLVVQKLLLLLKNIRWRCLFGVKFMWKVTYHQMDNLIANGILQPNIPVASSSSSSCSNELPLWTTTMTTTTFHWCTSVAMPKEWNANIVPYYIFWIKVRWWMCPTKLLMCFVPR